MITIEHEGHKWNGDKPECCIFCGNWSRWWHKKTNTPVCSDCANIKGLGDIEAAKTPTRTIAPW